MPEKKTKNYLLDTSVILDDVHNLQNISDQQTNNLFITNIVFFELNNKKKDMSEAGFNARDFFRRIDKEAGKRISLNDLPIKRKIKNRLSDKDKFYQMTIVMEDGTPIPLYIIWRKNYKVDKDTSSSATNEINDARIAEIGLEYNLKTITNDNGLKIYTKILGGEVENIFDKEVTNSSAIEFVRDINIEEEEKNKQLFEEDSDFTAYKIHTNNGMKFAMKLNGVVQDIDLDDENLFKGYVKPLNTEQKIYFYMLTNTNSNITVVSGSTGSGKTLLAIQAALDIMERDKDIDGILYARNTVTANDKEAELGFRKGGQDEKLGYFMYPLYNSINFIIEEIKKKKGHSAAAKFTGETNTMKKEYSTDLFMKENNIDVIDIAHLRGTTVSNKVLIIDEAQNLSPATMKLIGTRVGENTKIIIMGDDKQIDHPYLSKNRNALVHMMSLAYKDNYIGAIKLKKTIRSKTAEWFDNHL